jgi:two-component system chemotaxis response regulator CheY
MKILIVDDMPVMRALLAAFCDSQGFEHVAAVDGKDALIQLALNHPFDLVLIDWDMPVMTGIELVKAIRANPSYNDMPLMMVTTRINQENVEEAIKEGADDYLMKPVTEEMFLEKLRILGFVE